MNRRIKTKLPLYICLLISIVGCAFAQADAETPIADYIFETIEVPGVDFLEVAASNDFGDYAGNTRSPDGEKIIGFTLIDGVFATYDFPSSVNTFFYALDNTGKAAGHYKGVDNLYHGVVLEEGELRQYDFPGAVQTFIFGISDETGALSGNIVNESGITRGFSGDLAITFPGAVKTYADFVNAAGVVVGSYIDSEGMPHGFMRNPDGSFVTIDVPEPPNLRFLFVNAINDLGVVVFRAKAVDDIQRSYILLPDSTIQELRYPGSVNTVVRNINQDRSIIGYYDSIDGRRLGFVGRPATQLDGEDFGNIFSMHLSKGLNMMSVPLKPTVRMTAQSLALKTGATAVITLDPMNQQFVAWTPNTPDNGFHIEGAKGYIVNIPKARNVVFTGTGWKNQDQTAAAPHVTASAQTWAFVVTGHLEGKPTFDSYKVIARNLRTDRVITTSVRGDYFVGATADLARRSVVQVGDVMEIRVVGPYGNIESDTFNFEVTSAHLENAVMSLRLDAVGRPMQSQLLQNYPNPFNPETWIPYQLSHDSSVSISIHDTAGVLVRTLSLGFQSAGFYNSRARSAYWDGRNDIGERVASGNYYYRLTTPSYDQTRRLVVKK